MAVAVTAAFTVAMVVMTAAFAVAMVVMATAFAIFMFVVMVAVALALAVAAMMPFLQREEFPVQAFGKFLLGRVADG